MRNSLSILCENFIENRDTIKATFGWESTYLYPVCATIFTDKGQKADPEKMKSCLDILKNQVGLFSSFRGTGKLVMTSMLAIDNEPEQKLKNALDVFSLLKEHFFSSQFLPLASMIITNLTEPEHYANIAKRTRHIYELMKKAHPFLTSSEDSVFAALLALSHLTDEQILTETKDCYDLLKPKFFSSNAVQSLCHVLALSEGTAEEKYQRTMALFNDLQEKGYRYGTNYELATLGVLAMLPKDSHSVIDDIIDVDHFLSAQKGYGFWGIPKKQRLMHAGMLVTSDYMGNPNNTMMNSAAIGATLSLIAAQQAAMCAVIASTSAASAASN
ncbi:DUF4003 family protein [Anaerotignum sp.]|uniref:DUF4003 family protein n=1 Tax=Anaerotignum sp. TaxID=2039241 RepID=UPI0027149ABB|nr:DUF4003 family protein [Anaerotignum sp.]